MNTYEQRFPRGPRPLWSQFYLPTYLHTYIPNIILIIIIIIIVGQDALSNDHRQSGTRGLRPLLAQAPLTLCLPVA